jgi:DNA-directed RNA polymerase subunit omega
MSYASVDRLAEKVESRYTLVVLAARRAKQLREGAPKTIETTSTNPLTIALEEIASGTITFRVADNDDLPSRDVEPELEVVAGVASAQAEAAEITSEPIDEAARVAQLLQVPVEEEEPEAEAVSVEEEAPAESEQDTGEEAAAETTEEEQEPELDV